MTPEAGGRTVGEWTAAATVIYSLILAAGAGYVFYASIRPVTIPTGYFAEFADYPWLLAFLVLLAVWVLGPLVLLVLGLVKLLQHERRRWWFAAGWLSALAGATAIGRVIVHDFVLLLTAFPRDVDGTPLGPSRFAPGAPYWQALIAASGELAVCAIMITLIVALPRKAVSRDPRPTV
jgi:hypothetical protein